MMSPAASASGEHGQVIAYIEDRLYLASYTSPPDEDTPFPYPINPSRSPSKRSSRAQQHGSRGSKLHQHPPVYFSMDDTLLYNAFHHDFGPLHVGHVFRFAVYLHALLADQDNEGRAVVFWSRADSRSRANSACLLACYMVLIQAWPPHLALAPIAQAEPPYMPFRDAGYSQADYVIGIQDVVYGVWRAKEERLCDLQNFSVEEYEKFERVDMGDFNWLTPDFLAFASPQHAPVRPVPVGSAQYDELPKSVGELSSAKLPTPFKNVLAHFSSRNIGLVVRLNSELYSPSYFTALGIEHLDMIFDDGTCPPLPLVRKFIRIAHDMITVQKKGIAVHCKAGLGRTGCLIGAYLIYRHGFTANEMIAFMRFMRPGMVVGPQQHWLHLNQGAFREWWWEDTFKEKYANTIAAAPVTPTKSSKARQSRGAQMLATPPPNNPSSGSRRSPLGEVDHNGSSAREEHHLPAPTPGQPRKTSRAHHSQHHHPYSRRASVTPAPGPPESEVVATHRQTRREGESEEEWQLRMMRRAGTTSPHHVKEGREGSEKPRAVSYTTTTTTTTSYELGLETGGDGSDVENRDAVRRSPTGSGRKSGSGAGGLSVGKVRSPKRAGEGVRKTSVRVGSAQAAMASPRKS